MQNSTLLQSLTPDQLGDIIDGRLEIAFDKLFQKLGSSKSSDDLLTRNEICDLLKINLSTLHHYRKAGKIKALGIGSRIYFRRSDIDEALIPLEQ